jgi:ketosteroid isomerase-like protein
MSQENVEVVRRVLSEWERGNFGTGEFFDPDVHVRWINPIFVHRSETHGLEELSQAMVEFLDAWEQITARAERIVSAGDQVISVEIWRGRGRASGIETEVHHSSIWSVVDGKVTYFANYGNPDAAFEAAGLSE